jgi:hypothetical protein
MQMSKSKEEQIFIGDNDTVVELLGEAKTEFIAIQEQMKAEILLLETEYKAKQDARESAIKKLAEVAGLTEEEIEGLIR